MGFLHAFGLLRSFPALVVLLTLGATFCASAAPATAPAAEPAAPALGEMVIYDGKAGGLKNGWQDWGWAHRTLLAGGPVQLNMSRYAGWILAHRDLEGSFAALKFVVRAPASFGDFLEVRLGADGAGADDFPKIPVPLAPDAQGVAHVSIAIASLNPGRLPFDRVVFRARQNVAETLVAFDAIELVRGAALAKAPAVKGPPKPITLRVLCRAPSRPISPLIYGIAFSPRHVGKEEAPFQSGATIRRWGGNPASRYNPSLGNAWNTASDWFFQNVNYTNRTDYSWRDFLAENQQHGMVAAVTVPMLGWVAKDTDAHSFSVSALGAQKYSQGDAGNGIGRDNKPIPSPSPQTTSIAAPPAFVGEWVQQMEGVVSSGGKAVAQYILDNEPALWNSTHRDVHPEPLTYDELWEKTVAYGEAVRRAAPKADISGPAEWGWPNYFFSALDAKVGFRAKPDRRAHGDVPLLAWYLRKLHARAKASGLDILSTLDVHFYPQISGVYGRGEQTSPVGAQKRLRATRSLWDPTYKDESWIADTIELLPRLQRLIDQEYPGRGISIGEYNFGGERHISGGLAQAEALGRFGQAGVRSAYLWTYPPNKSFSQQAFLAYRNYDGQGGHFLEESVPTAMHDDISLFASRNAERDKFVAVALNLQNEQPVDATIELDGCGEFGHVRAYQFNESSPELAPLQADAAPHLGPKRVSVRLSAYSATVLELTR